MNRLLIAILPAIFLLVTASSWSVAAEKPVPPAAAANKRPNVIFFLADDLGYFDISAHGNPHIKTPQIDTFAREAVEFNRFYTAPICNPTRAALMTGRYTFRTFAKLDFHMDPAEVTIAEMLRPAGYKTALFGKWHLGDEANECPNAQGFEEVVTFPKGQLKTYFNPTLIHNQKNEKYQGYCMDIFTNLAIDFIKKHRNEPFFIYLPANLVHDPLIPPHGGAEPFAKMGLGQNLSKLYGMTKSVDDNFGRLRAALKESGLEENTLMILGSDNGPSIDKDGKLTKFAGERMGSMRGMKGLVYENGIRTPWYMRWPAQFAGGKKVNRIVAHIDILPTILEACGVAAPKGIVIDGKSVLPLLRDPSAAWADRTLFIQWDSNVAPRREMCFAAITDTWKLVQPLGMSHKTPVFGGIKRYDEICKAIGYEQRKVTGPGQRFELYDISKDPGEKTDLAKQHPEIVEKLRKEYKAWFDQISATARWKNAPAAETPETQAESIANEDVETFVVDSSK